MVSTFKSKLVVSAVFLIGGATAVAGCASDDLNESAEINLQIESEMWAFQENSIMACMRDHGFDYVTLPAPPSSGNQIAQSPYALSMDDARTHGFGYVESAAESAGASETSDANTFYRESLSADVQLAYDHALEGDPRGTDPGCRSQAQEAAYAEYADEFRTILGSTDTLLEAVSDPRYIQFESDWSECMTSEGYPTTSFEEFHRGWVLNASEIVVISETDTGDISHIVDPALVESALQAEVEAAITNVTCLEPLKDDFDDLIDDVLS